MKHTLTLLPLLLALAAAPAAAQATPPSRSIAIGQTVVGQLDAADAKQEDGSFYETWTFQARAGQRLIISMGSSDMDTYLILGYMEGGEFHGLEEGDDAYGSTDSSIEFSVRRDGTYVIRASSFAEGETGPYTLLVFDPS
jgi:hypothetical protein